MEEISQANSKLQLLEDSRMRILPERILEGRLRTERQEATKDVDENDESEKHLMEKQLREVTDTG